MFALNLPLACVTTAVQSWIPSNLQVSSLHYQKFTRFNLWKKRKRAWWIEIHIEPLKCTRVVHARYSETKNVPVILCKYRVKHENCSIQVHQNETNTHGHLKSEYCTNKNEPKSDLTEISILGWAFFSQNWSTNFEMA